MKLTDIKNTTFFVILVAIIIGCFSLGIWQIDRYSQKQQQHDTPSADLEVADLIIEAAELIHAQNNEALVDKTVNINGSFITDSIIKLDNKMFNSTYGVDLFSLFKEKTSNKVYLVNMGWHEVGNKREKLKQHFDFSSIHSLQAKIANIPSKPPFISQENFRDEKQLDLWLFINKEYLIKQHDTPIEELILVNLEPTDQLKYRTVVKEDNSFMHILYAIQWFLFALFALFGLTKIYK